MAKGNKNLWKELYTEIESLGEGGNAKVVKVTNNITKEECALKYLCHGGIEKKARFIDEINIMKENAPVIQGILPISEYSYEQFWYTMPVAKSAIDYNKDNNLNYIQIVLGVVQLTETLVLLHRKGIAHRDIKPSNIYHYDNRYYFGDFGLVEFPDNPNDFTRSDKGLGAIFTIAPEMKRDPKHADGKKADVFSLAKTMWMLLTGDEKGFDGKYNFFDESIRLRNYANLESAHLVELEEVLTAATDNNPDNRPTMQEFHDSLLVWLDVVNDFEKAQLSGWKFLNRCLFNDNEPTSSAWKRREQIVQILNTVGGLTSYNHMLLSDRGGLDFWKAELANEEGCMYIYDTGGICFLIKPKCLYYEGFEDNYRWNYFLLELDSMEPIFEVNEVVNYEYLVEDYPGHYVSAQYAQYGVYDYDSGEKLPEGFKTVRRYLGGKFLIVLKKGPYNGISATYDGRHGMCSNTEFREYLESIIKVVDELVDKGANEKAVLNSKMFFRNPFAKQQNYFNRVSGQKENEEAKKYISDYHKEWCFKEFLSQGENVGNAKYCVSYEWNEGFLFDLLDNCEYLCRDGYFKNVDDTSDEIYYVYDREEAKNLIDICNGYVEKKYKEKGLLLPEYESFLCLQIKKCCVPKHLFSKSEIEKAMREADDRKDNRLVIDENGFPKVIQNITEGHLYPVSLESWSAGNMYVGKYSSLSSLSDDYISLLQGWLDYLKYGGHVNVDYLGENCDEDSLLAEIKAFYASC